jgi:hypothetical protein
MCPVQIVKSFLTVLVVAKEILDERLRSTWVGSKSFHDPLNWPRGKT